MADSDLDSGFVRQRRNLILISLGLLASLHYGLTFEKINLLGNETSLPGSRPVAGLLWWFWGYFLWRYWTAFMDIGDRGIARTYDAITWKLIQGRAAAWFQTHQHEMPTGAQYSGVSPETMSTFQILDISWTIYGDNPNDIKKYGKVRWSMPGFLYYSCRVAALARLIGSTSYVSEFIVPFLFAAAPVGYWLWLSSYP